MILLMSVVSVFVSACSRKYPITYNTNPVGANVVCAGISKGYSPITLYYDSKEFEKTNYRTQQCEAIWVSGARSYFSSEWNEAVRQYPEGVTQTLQRPTDYPNLEKDMEFAFQVEQFKYNQSMQQRQMQLQELQYLQQVNQQLQQQQQMQQLNQNLQQHNFNNTMFLLQQNLR